MKNEQAHGYHDGLRGVTGRRELSRRFGLQTGGGYVDPRIRTE